ncbi:hypothetical protein SAMN04487902_10578 [Prevotella sp. ne3005]|nr:hypothetical protein SAMN04487902_10578 [Prevotella sp. ne3005]
MPIVVMAHLRKICTLTLKESTLFTHAQCMRVHYDDGWTEQIARSQNPLSFNHLSSDCSALSISLS